MKYEQKLNAAYDTQTLHITHVLQTQSVTSTLTSTSKTHRRANAKLTARIGQKIIFLVPLLRQSEYFLDQEAAHGMSDPDDGTPPADVGRLETVEKFLCPRRQRPFLGRLVRMDGFPVGQLRRILDADHSNIGQVFGEPILGPAIGKGGTSSLRFVPFRLSLRVVAGNRLSPGIRRAA